MSLPLPCAAIRLLCGFAITVMVTFVLSALAQTGFVLAGLVNSGAELSVATVLKTALADLYGLAFLGVVSYPLLLALGWLLAFTGVAAVVKLAERQWYWLYPLAGAAMMGLLLAAMPRLFYGMSLYAGTRGNLALAVQALAGAAGGLAWLWWWLKKPLCQTHKEVSQCAN